jgi:hypothetical protein
MEPLAGLHSRTSQRELGRRRSVHAQAELIRSRQRPPELGSYPCQPLYLVPHHLQPGQPRHPPVSLSSPPLPPLFI